MDTENNHQPDAQREAPPSGPTKRGGGIQYGLFFLLLVIAAIAIVGILPRQDRASRLEAQAAERAEPPRVMVVRVSDAPAETLLTLPASVRARDAVDVLARADGYVRAYHVDLGAEVRAGQLIAEMSAPERDDEIRVASVRVSEAERLSLTRTTSGRTTQLSTEGVLSGQESDDAQLGLTSVSAALDSSRAELRRLQTLRGYQRIVAPFDGVVTARLVQQGSLVRAGTTVLFSIERREVTVTIDVPQEHVAAITQGMEVEVLSGERPLGMGRVARLASSLSPSTRAMRIEVDVDGPIGLRSGMFLRARLHAPRTESAVILPARALVSTADGSATWVIGEGDLAQRRVLSILRDRGRDLEISSGLHAGDRVVLSPPDGLSEGTHVTPVERPATPPPAAPSARPTSAAGAR